MPKHFLSKRENNYQHRQSQQYQQRAKQDAALAKLGMHSLILHSGLRFDSTQAGLIGFLLFTVAIASLLPQTEAIPADNSTRLDEINYFNRQFNSPSKVIIQAVTQPINYYGINDMKLRVSKGLCNSTKLVGGHPLFFKCSVDARNTYAADRANYEKDITAVQASLQKLNEQHVVKCKLNALFKDPEFRVRMVLPENFVEGYGDAQYDAGKSVMAVSVNATDTPEHRRVLQHMIHSGFMSNQNKHFKRNMLDEKHGGVDLYSTREEYTRWLRSIKSGAVNIHKYVNLLNVPSSMLNQQQQIQLAKFREVTANYQPYNFIDIVSDIEALQLWVSQGFVDSNYRVKAPGFFASQVFGFNYLTSKDNSYDLSALKYMVASEKPATGDYYIFNSRSVKDPSDTARAALNDAIIVMSVAFDESNIADFKDFDFDAYLHELFEPYPQLFTLLFSELQNYHLARSTDEYKSCLRM